MILKPERDVKIQMWDRRMAESGEFEITAKHSRTMNWNWIAVNGGGTWCVYVCKWSNELSQYHCIIKLQKRQLELEMTKHTTYSSYYQTTLSLWVEW